MIQPAHAEIYIVVQSALLYVLFVVICIVSLYKENI